MPTNEEWQTAVFSVNGNGEAPAAVEAEAPTDDEVPPDETVEPAAASSIEELVLQLASEEDPWAILSRIRSGVIAGEGGNSENLYADRLRFYDMFCAKAALKSPHERDALMNDAKTVFHVSLQTLRDKINSLAETGLTEHKQALTVVGPLGENSKPLWIAEAVVDRAASPMKIKFLKWNFEPEPGFADPELLDEVTVGTIIYQPYQSQLILDGAMLMPEAIWVDDGDEGKRAAVAVDYRHDEGATSPKQAFEDVRAFIDRYFQVSNVYANVFALMILESWVFDLVESIGYTRASGDYGGGKSRFLRICAGLMRRALKVASVTPATLFRLMDKYQCTLVIDEADMAQKTEAGQEIERILLVGYEKSGRIPRVVKKEGGELVEELYNPFGPKALATRGEFSAALESRCATFTLPVYDETQLREEIPMLLPPEFRVEAQELQNKLQAWRMAAFNRLSFNYRRRFRGLAPRYTEVAIPLFSIVEYLDGAQDTPLAHDLRAFFVKLSDENKQLRSETFEGIVAAALSNAWPHRDRSDRVSLDRVVNGIHVTYPHLKDRLSSKTVADKLRRALNLDVHKASGTTQIFTTDERVEELRRTYNVSVAKTPVL